MFGEIIGYLGAAYQLITQILTCKMWSYLLKWLTTVMRLQNGSIIAWFQGFHWLCFSGGIKIAWYSFWTQSCLVERVQTHKGGFEFPDCDQLLIERMLFQQPHFNLVRRIHEVHSYQGNVTWSHILCEANQVVDARFPNDVVFGAGSNF